MSVGKNFGGLVIGGLGAVIVFVLYEHLKNAATVAAANATTQSNLANAPTLPRVDGSNSAIVPGSTPTLEPGGEYTCPPGQYAAIDAVTGKLYCIYEGVIQGNPNNIILGPAGPFSSIDFTTSGITGTF